MRLPWQAFRNPPPPPPLPTASYAGETTNEWRAHTLCVLHPGVFAVLLLDANPDDGPDDCLAGGNAARFVTLL